MILERASSGVNGNPSSYTSYKAVFASASRMKLALALGLKLVDKQLHAGRRADIYTLRVAFRLGLPHTDQVATGAAYSADLDKLIWLRTKQHCCGSLCAWLRAVGCPWNASACAAAAKSCHFKTLRWLHESGCPWDAEGICSYAVTHDSSSKAFELLQYMLSAGELADPALLTELLLLAGEYQQLAIAKWLRQQGAAWPPVLYNNLYLDLWNGDVLAWARAEGCTSPTQ
jgi:hypothetical protein